MNNLTINTRNFLVAATIVLGLGATTGVNSEDTSDRPIMNESPRSGENKVRA